MRVFNFLYTDDEDLKARLSLYHAESSILIQIFDGTYNEKHANKLIRVINAILPHSEVLLSSSAAEISDGAHYQGQIAISVSLFARTKLKTQRFKGSDCTKISNDIVAQLVSDETKLVIILGHPQKLNAAELLHRISVLAPNLNIIGGNAGDDASYTNIFVGDKFGTQDLSVVCAALDSHDLQVYMDFIFEWRGIGINLVVTDSAPSGVVKTINNMPVREVYRRYLGDEVADNLPASGVEIPLVFERDGLKIARSSVGIFSDGSVKYAGDVPVGTKVQFGFCSFHSSKESVCQAIDRLKNLQIDGIFMYSCYSRYIYCKSNVMTYELASANNLAPTSGFFTFGEFYHKGKGNYLLNSTNVIVALSEGLDEPKEHTIREISEITTDGAQMDFLLNSLHHFISHTNDDYLQMTNIFKQYKDMLEESTIMFYMNAQGDITNANEAFLEITKYARNEIVGKKFSYIIAGDSATIAAQIWESIQRNNLYKGAIMGVSKDSSYFYVNAVIKPIKDIHNHILMFVCSMEDATDIEMQNQALQSSIAAVTEINVEKDKAVELYQSLLDNSTAMVRIRCEVVVEVNKYCEKLFKYTDESPVGKHLLTFIDTNLMQVEGFVDRFRLALTTNGYFQTYIPCVDRNGGKLHIQAYFMAINIKKQKTHDEEVIGILHNVTEIFNVQKELEDVQKEVIYAMGAIAEGHSRETGNHVKRVAEYSYLIAKLYGLSTEQMNLLKTASPMHDIGKLAIPDAILNKPGKLTPDEFEIMKTHTTRGYEMLCFSNRPILKASAQIALTHHEWWNGEGYPNKLKGEEIPLFGRITAVADVFDALSNDRCYKKAWSIPEVVEYMIERQGTQFQSELVDLLVENLDDFVAIKTEFEDKFD